MPVDVEGQLAALGEVWNTTIAHVEPSEILSPEAARSGGSVVGIEFIEEEATMIDLQAESHVKESRKGSRRVLLAALVAAAAVVVAIALVLIRRDDPVSPANEPPTTVAAPQALFGPSDAKLTPGTYVIDEVDGALTPQILVTVGAGWSTSESWAIYKGEGQVMTFSRPDGVFLDACQPGDGVHPGPLTTLDGLANALHEQRGWINVSTLSNISIDGYAGKAFQRATPADLSSCTNRQLTSWDGGTGQSYYPAGDTETVWVLDLDGTVIVLETRVNAGQPAEAHAELAAILDSIEIAG